MISSLLSWRSVLEDLQGKKTRRLNARDIHKVDM